MMLDQINKRLAESQKERAMQAEDVAAEKKVPPGLASPQRIPGSKVIAVDVDPETYALLEAVAKKHKVRGVRGALRLAVKSGLRHL